MNPTVHPASPDSARPRGSGSIGDYAVIGDGRSAALVSKTGSIDWLCLPRFDSGSVFAALLDPDRGGRFRIGPTAAAEITRRYRDGTHLLETTFRTRTGVLRLTDLMAASAEAEKERELLARHEILRIAECLEGTVELELECAPRPEYGAVQPQTSARGRLGIFFTWGSECLVLRTEFPCAAARAGAALGRAVLKAGERRRVSLCYARGEPAVIPPLGDFADLRAERTARWWENWSRSFRYDGVRPDVVLRSALTLKLLIYAPSGAIVAAPTTSLPEDPGGVRNWDYRYCWLRDASGSLSALLDLGFIEEGHAFFSWLIEATALTHPRIRVFYDVHGDTRAPERTLGDFRGFAGSRPVRIGNAAVRQLQLDVYGELADAALRFVQTERTLDGDERRLLVEMGKVVCDSWRLPDEGIWEPRSGRKQNTHSKVLCWTALDRLLRLQEITALGIPADRFRAERDAIREAVRDHAWNPALSSYTTVLGGDTVDASLLLLSHFGFEDGRSARMRGTWLRVRERLGSGDLLYRYHYDDGLPGGEGAFGPCCFWAVESLAHQGRIAESESLFLRLLEFGNDVGLFSEEIDPGSGAALGNFPQAYTHLALIDAALALAQAKKGPVPEAKREPEKTGQRDRTGLRPPAEGRSPAAPDRGRS